MRATLRGSASCFRTGGRRIRIHSSDYPDFCFARSRRAAVPRARGAELSNAHAHPGAGHSACCSKAAICSASRRRAPARRPPSRCRSCNACPHRMTRASPRACAHSSSRRRASSPCRSARASRPTAATCTSRREVILGGVSQGGQVKALAKGVDILVATPGRLLDLAQQRHVRLDQVDAFRPRRSRPHARHGLHPRRAQDRGDAAEAAPVAPLLGHHAEGCGRSRRTASCAILRAWK